MPISVRRRAAWRLNAAAAPEVRGTSRQSDRLVGLYTTPTPGPPSEIAAYGADDGIRTRDPNLGKVVLYQLSHVRATQPYQDDFDALPVVAVEATVASATLVSSSRAVRSPWAMDQTSGTVSRHTTIPKYMVPM